jgi:hypothetical protein
MDKSGSLTPRPDRFTAENDPVPILYEAWLPAARACLDGCGELASPGIQSLYRPARSESPYCLCYLGRLTEGI